MPETQQGIVVEDFEYLNPEDMSIIILALEQLRAREENVRLSSSGRKGERLPETEISHRALAAYEKITNFDDEVKLHHGIRHFILVPLMKYRLIELLHAFDREL